jgi:predicted RNA-binding Zn-ribbon protein involved in translation (DUF1610 family)
MPIETESRTIPNDVVVRCPQCGHPGKKLDVRREIFECPNCLLQFEAMIEISWDSKHFTKSSPARASQ